MTPLLTAVASLGLAVAVIAAFALWLRHHVNREIQHGDQGAMADRGPLACEAVRHGDVAGD